MNPEQEYTVEWARETLKTLEHTPRRPMVDYLDGPDLITAKLALKVLAVNANPKLSRRNPRYAVHEAGGRIRIKVFLSPVAAPVKGLRRI